MKPRALYELGAKAKREIGKSTDKIILHLVEQNPGIVLTALAKELRWTKGKVQGSITRLERTDLIYSKLVLKQGKTVRRMYDKDYKEPELGVIEVPRQLINPERWGNTAYLYGSNRSTIAIESKAARADSPIKAEVPIKWKDGNMVIRLPEQFVNFYTLENSEYSISSIGEKGDNALVIIEATVVSLTR